MNRADLYDWLRHPDQRLPGTESTQATRMVGARLLLSWMETLPGDTWQQRWLASPAAGEQRGWYAHVQAYARTLGRATPAATIQAGMHALICADVIRPDLAWLMANSSRFARPAIQHSRDPEGFARLEAAGCPGNGNLEAAGCPGNGNLETASAALLAIAQMIAAYGGTVQDITVGDCLALLQAAVGRQADTRNARLAYLWLRELGQFPPDAPGSLLSFSNRAGQVSVEMLVDRYQLQCKPVRDLIVDYLSERRPSIDYSSLRQLSTVLAKLFWSDLERHHPGIESLRLDKEVATAWKVRLATKTVRRRQPDGTTALVTEPRETAPAVKQLVRAFYLDIAHWALEEPERWGRWAAPVPISQDEWSVRKLEQRQKSRSDQRTRERLPVLPVLVRVAERRLKEARARLDALNAADPGSKITVLGETFTLPLRTARLDGRPTNAYDAHGRRRHLGTEEKRAFWAWATIEILRHTGIRIEELGEIGHHSIISYKLPTSGEVIPLLQIAPSKNDQERLLLVTPELADVLSAVISRIRSADGTVPLVHSYDSHERTWNPPMPLLYQWQVSGENRQISQHTIRDALNETLMASGLTDASGRPLTFAPHDFRRIFITDAIMNGLPPHIAQVIAGHGSINTTMGYAATYPMDAIEAHQAFIARRRAVRPPEEYRAVTAEEWEQFLGHFERRKLALGDCGRAYGTDCVHEHACVRCPLLIVSPSGRPRLVEIRDNLADRIAEAEREGWLGEVEGLNVSLAAAEEKISQLDARQERRNSAVFIGIPTFDQVAARTSDIKKP
ncbi:site-specific integrase [Streptomyces sp. NBC_01669]|uniref:site-specific integrase n=1 Tax=Streptomyces sp. NBC_01669 TaxID=2975909 RepID=UPI002257A4DC|nr:site-specific integrase [Streptomyces sp. NBC_01669]MCX4537925.1 site-specific integrase [Streptomyces sp. NBC_01669]